MSRLIPFACLIALIAAQPLAAQAAPDSPDVIGLDQAIRCSAAFAITAGDQQRGVAAAAQYPPLRQRGREFFVRTGARLMDEQHLNRAQLQQRIKAEVARLQAETAASPNPAAAYDAVIRPCLALLDVTIPAGAGQ